MNSVIHGMLFTILFGYYGHSAAQEIITQPDRSDGFGGQLQTIVNAAIYAELMGKKYVYTPFVSMEHNYDNDSLFLQKKEWLINFKDNFELNAGNAVRPSVQALIAFFEAHLPEAMKTESLKKIKRIFRENKDVIQYFNSHQFNIAVHIRRPNSHDNRILGTDTPEAVFLNAIEKLRIIYRDKKPVFHIYSQGEFQSFKKFESSDVILHLNDPVESSFASLVLADVLITSPSSFSYVAGILSEGNVYYVPFWHKPMPGWISVQTI